MNDLDVAAGAAIGSRAIGAMFLAGFGGAWVGLWAERSFAQATLVVAGVVCVSAALAGLAYLRYRRHRAALAAVAGTPARRARSRAFHIVNIVQWVLIIAVGNLLVHVGLSTWVVPAVILIVGMHFLPLARVFGYRAHYVTGTALILVAAVYPFAAAGGAASPVGCLAAGAILWASALRAATS